jgi:hypothetical protein
MIPSQLRVLAQLGSLLVIGDMHGNQRTLKPSRNARKCANPSCTNLNTGTAPYCSAQCCRQARATRKGTSQ